MLIFVEKKKIIKCSVWRVAVGPSYIQDARFLKVKCPCYEYVVFVVSSCLNYVTEKVFYTCGHIQMSYLM